MIHLGDVLQLSPTANIGLITDVNEKNEDGSYVFEEPPTVEIQHAIRLFGSIPHVFELRGTKRFKAGDPLADFLSCMRNGRKFPPRIWSAFQKTFAADNQGTLDERHKNPRFLHGFGLAMYWETLSRWISQRAQRDARALGTPLVFLQAVDECGTIDRSAAQRLLNIPNLRNTAHIPGVLPAHLGMRVRFTMKMNGRLGLVQDQKGTIVDFLWHEDDRLRFNRAQDEGRPGAIFRPRYLPAGIWLEVDDFEESPIAADAYEFIANDTEEALLRDLEFHMLHEELPVAHIISWIRHKRSRRARALILYNPVRQEFTWKSSGNHRVARTGYGLTHDDVPVMCF